MSPFKRLRVTELLPNSRLRYGIPAFLFVVFLQGNLIVMFSTLLYRSYAYRLQGLWTPDAYGGSNTTGPALLLTHSAKTTRTDITITGDTARQFTRVFPDITTAAAPKHVARKKGLPKPKSKPKTHNYSECAAVIPKFLTEYKRECEHLSALYSYHRQAAATTRTLPDCPCIPPLLHGLMNITFDKPLIGEIELKHQELQNGGRWRPPHCRARQKIALIVPFRDREEHLKIFLNHMHPILQRQLLDYTIFVVEQKTKVVFNKAMMMNVGFVEANKLYDYDCIIFHDVDLLSEDDRNFYTCSKDPRHAAPYLRKWNYVLPYSGLFGGVIALHREHFKQSNGFSNTFFGWGGEDDDMYRRIKAAKLQIVRRPACIARYTMIKHTRDKHNPWRKQNNVAWKYRPSVYKREGLNTLRYKSVEIERRPLYTWLYVDIEEPARYS